MELLVERITKTAQSTVGKFYVDGVLECYCLEPADRGLTSNMTIGQIAAIKIAGKTAVPTGRYRVTKCFSPKHNAEVPLINDVPGFEFVEIHKGNFPTDTDACLLLGAVAGQDEVLNSAVAINAFYPKVFAALANGESVWITYQ